MKLRFIFFAVLILAQTIQAQDETSITADTTSAYQITDQLGSIDVPNWQLHFGIFSLPVLNSAQQFKRQYNRIVREIAKLENDVEVKRSQLLEKKEALSRLLKGEMEETNSSSLLLGLFSQEKKTKGIKTIYNEKRLFWGAIKWGKRKPKEEK